MQFNYGYSSRMANLNGTATREIFKLLSRPEIISFAGGLPATECLPVEKVKQIANELLSSADALKLLQYGTTEGYPNLIKALKTMFSGVGITNVLDSETLVISGGQQGIDLACKTFLNAGDNVLVEDPTYLAVLQILNSYEANAYGVKATDSGLDIDDLEKKIKKYKPKMLYVVPTFSNPTGKTYSVQNRKEIARVTAKYGVMVLEDDPYSRLRFSGEKVPALKTFDVAGNIVYITSCSKILSPGLRVGGACGNSEVIRKMAICKQGTDLHTSLLAQAICAEYVNRGYLEPDVEKGIPIYRTRKQAMMQAIQKYMPSEYTHTDPDGGLFIWGEIDANINTVTLLPEAVNKNVAYIQGQVFYADGSGLNTIRLNYSNASPEKIEIGIKALGELLKTKIAEAKKA